MKRYSIWKFIQQLKWKLYENEFLLNFHDWATLTSTFLFLNCNSISLPIISLTRWGWRWRCSCLLIKITTWKMIYLIYFCLIHPRSASQTILIVDCAQDIKHYDDDDCNDWWFSSVWWKDGDDRGVKNINREEHFYNSNVRLIMRSISGCSIFTSSRIVSQQFNRAADEEDDKHSGCEGKKY